MMKVLHILGGRKEDLTLGNGGDNPIAFYCDKALYLTGVKSGREVEVVLILDLLSKEIIDYFPSLFDDGSPVRIGGSEDEIHDDPYYESFYNAPFKLIDSNGEDLFAGMTARRFSELLSVYCELFGYEDIGVIDLVYALSFELLNPGRMSEYEDYCEGFFYRFDGYWVDMVSKRFPDLSPEEIEQKLRDNPNSLSNDQYVCYLGYDNGVLVFKR